jgi:nucleoside-diphosphate-sugar epimerase
VPPLAKGDKEIRAAARTPGAQSGIIKQSMSTYLITGIAGFIGSSLARAILELGDKARGIDNFSTGKRSNIAELLDRIDLREADLLDLDSTQSACRGVDYVLHEAAIPSVPIPC